MEDIRHEIALDIYKSGWLLNECNKEIPTNEQLRDDLFQEIMMIILTFKDNGGLQLAYSKGQHLPFIKRIILNQIRSTTSPFYKVYRKYSAGELNEELTKDNTEEYDD